MSAHRSRADAPAGDERRASTAPWHADATALRRFLGDFLLGEIAALRPGGGTPPPPPWKHDLRIDENGLGLDSVERLAVAAALSEALHLRDSGVEDLLRVPPVFGEWLDLLRAALIGSDSRLTFRTSGSSGTPKPCVHALADLQQEADFWAGALGRISRVFAAVPAHHIYGFLFTVLLPARVGGLEVVDARRLTPQALQRQLRADDLLVGHPLQWSLLARYGQALPGAVTGVTSGAPCPDELAGALERLGLARLVQVYGSSETAGVGWRSSPACGYRLLPFWSRDPAHDGGLIRHLPHGAARTQPLQDRLIWHPDGSFAVGERLDAAVQVAGVNVHPGEVRRTLLEHPAVADAAVRLMRPEEGNRLKAFIVPNASADAAALPEELMRWSTTRLRVAERPKSFTLGGQLPVDERGKLRDWPLEVGDPAGPLATPRS